MDVAPSLADRIRGEFREMPGLKLTPGQACRLWNLNERLCGQVLDQLVAEGFLFRTPSGAFIAAPAADRMALKAALPHPMRALRCPSCRHLNSLPAEILVRPAATIRCAACARVVHIGIMSA